MNACRACGINVRIPPEQLEKILADYLANNPQPLAEQPLAEHRRAICNQCPDHLYGTTCRHCACLTPVLTLLAGSRCPAAMPRW